MPENEKLIKQREYAWNYFQLHAGQRMSLFNFFVLISALLTAGLAGTFRKDCDFHALGLVLGLNLIVISIVFWRLDRRVGYLIKHAEEILRSLESCWAEKNDNIDENLALFSKEERKTSKLRAELRKKYPCLSRICPITYSECFLLIYLVFVIVGIVGIILSVVKIVTV